jgi:hypothetical protein
MEPLVQAWLEEEVATRCNHGLFSQVKAYIALKARVAVAGAVLFSSTTSTPLLSLPSGFCPLAAACSKEL